MGNAKNIDDLIWSNARWLWVAKLKNVDPVECPMSSLHTDLIHVIVQNFISWYPYL